MRTALILVAVVVGSVLFHLLSPWWLTPIASNWHYIDSTVSLTFWITGFVFIAVVLFTAYCVLCFPLSPSGGKTRSLRARKQDAGIMAHGSNCGWSRYVAGSRSLRYGANS
jgi:cytochrome c oxidase subunit II